MFNGFDSEKFLAPNYSNFAIEFDWISKISHNLRISFFFYSRNSGFFGKKTQISFLIGKGFRFSVERVLNDIF